MELRDERKVVTVLFADLVGSTPLGGVLAFFGAPVTSEDDPERAIRAGIRIADELADLIVGDRTPR
jgi:class 3 adenylate cyclase